MFSWHTLKSTDASKFSKGFKILEADTFDDSWRMEYLERAITKHCWSPIIIKGGHRLEKNFLGSYICALDFDAPYTPLACAIEEFKDFSHIIATTKSHQKPKNGVVCDRYRVVLWWERLITDLAEYKFNLAKQIDNYYSDKQCKDGARFFFPCVDIVSSNGNGKVIEVVKPPALDVAPKKVFTRYGLSGIKKDIKIPNSGSRNTTCFVEACKMFDQRVDPRKILDNLRSMSNGLSERELNTIFASAKRKTGN